MLCQQLHVKPDKLFTKLLRTAKPCLLIFMLLLLWPDSGYVDSAVQQSFDSWTCEMLEAIALLFL